MSPRAEVRRRRATRRRAVRMRGRWARRGGYRSAGPWGIHNRPPPRVGRPDQPTRPARAACRVFPHGATRTPRRRPAPARTQGRLRNQRGPCSSPIAQPAPPAAPIGVTGRCESPALPRKEEPVLARSRLARHSALDDSRKRSIVIRDTTRLLDSRKATVLRLVGCSRADEHRLGVPPVTIQHGR